MRGRGGEKPSIPSEGRADLHVHTGASDGVQTPEEVVQRACEASLAAVAITDHDEICGIPPAVEAAAGLELIVVPGIEINTDYEKEEAHILGYFIDTNSEVLNAHLKSLRESRVKRVRLMVEKLNAIGMKIDFERVMEISGEGSVGRPHVARTIKEAGYTRNTGAAYGKYLSRGAPGYVPRYKISPLDAIGIIREAGGAAVMAHPGKCRLDDLIPEMVKAGMVGLEAYHPDHKSSQTKRYVKMADKMGLLVTGGSDSHGPTVQKAVPIGQVTCDVSVVDQLRALADS